MISLFFRYYLFSGALSTIFVPCLLEHYLHLLLRLKTPFAFYLCTSEFTLLLRLPGTSGSSWLSKHCTYTKPEVIYPLILKSLLLKSHRNIVYVSFIGGISHPFWNQVRNKEISPGQCGRLLCGNGMLWLPWFWNAESTCLPESGEDSGWRHLISSLPILNAHQSPWTSWLWSIADNAGGTGLPGQFWSLAGISCPGRIIAP